MLQVDQYFVSRCKGSPFIDRASDLVHRYNCHQFQTRFLAPLSSQLYWPFLDISPRHFDLPTFPNMYYILCGSGNSSTLKTVEPYFGFICVHFNILDFSFFFLVTHDAPFRLYLVLTIHPVTVVWLNCVLYLTQLSWCNLIIWFELESLLFKFLIAG